MDPILTQKNNYLLNASITNVTSKLSDLEALPEPFQTCLAILYGGTALIAIISNILAIIILNKKKRSSADLRKYLINLATADISLAALSIPFSFSDFMYGYWKFPHFLCPITHFINICSVCVSIFTLTAIGIERYMAIVHPLRDFWWCESHTTYIICFIWILALATSSPLLFYSAAVPFNYAGITLYDCREEWEGELSSRIYTIILFIITFIIPFTALTFIYGSIGIKTFRHIQPGEAHTSRDRAQQRTKIKVVKMLLTLVTVFLICWLPIQIFNLIIWLFQDLRNPNTYFQYYLYFGLYFTFHLLSQFHTFLNPFIYCFMTNNFTVSDLRSIFGRRFWESCFDKSALHQRSANYVERTSVKRRGIVTPTTTRTLISPNISTVL